MNLSMILEKTMLKTNDPLLVGIFKILLIPVILILMITIVLIRFFPLFNHMINSRKYKDKHKVKGFVTRQSGPLIHTSYDDNCSCGKKEAPKDMGDFVVKLLR